MGTKHLSEVLTTKDILNIKNNKICIISGVGSGKNWFVEHELIKEGNILYITSRRAKVNEILEDKLAQEYITWEKEFGDIVTTTNYGVEKLVMNKKFGRSISEIIDHFSFIVVDEAHSILTDATYTNSSFHLLNFLKYVDERYPKVKIILMTGTPEPLMIFKDFIREFHIIDRYSHCINVLPNEIKLISKKDAIKKMLSLPKNQKTIYYSNYAKHIVEGKNSMYNQMIENGINSQEISICISQNKIDKYQKKLSNLSEICNIAKKSLLESNTLPKGTKYLLTTSTLKEGINILDETIKIAFCESHVLSDIQQFAGRVRNAIDVLYIIDDALQHDVNEKIFKSNILDAIYSYKYEVSNANSILYEIIKNPDSHLYKFLNFDADALALDSIMSEDYSLYTYGGEAVEIFVNYIENKFQYIKFNHLKNKFEYYPNRFIEQKRIHNIITYKKWRNELKDFCIKNNVKLNNNEIVDDKDISVDEIIEYLTQRVFIKYVEDDKKELIKYIANLLKLPSDNPQAETINSKLKKLGVPFEIIRGITTVKKRNKRYISIKPVEQNML